MARVMFDIRLLYRRNLEILHTRFSAYSSETYTRYRFYYVKDSANQDSIQDPSLDEPLFQKHVFLYRLLLTCLFIYRKVELSVFFCYNKVQDEIQIS